MSRKIFIFVALITLLITWQLFAVSAQSPEKSGSIDNHEPDRETLESMLRRSNYLFQQRSYPFGQIPDDWLIRANEHLRNNRSKIRAQQLEPLIPIGPSPVDVTTFNITEGPWAGRVTALATDPKDPAIIYLGAAGGGVWLSTDTGSTWQPITEDAPTQAVGSIAIDPNNAKTIYVGTGDGLVAATSFASLGILKSTDGGKTWTVLAADTFAGLGFNRIVVDNQNSNNLYAAAGISFSGIGRSGAATTRNGIYKSTDGGTSWTRVLAGNDFLSIPFDLVIDPKNTNLLYAAINEQGIYKSSDGGKSWRLINNGINSSSFDDPKIALSLSDTNIIYTTLDFGSDLKAYKSTDAGESWQQIKSPSDFEFAGALKVDPRNSDKLLFGGFAFYISNDGGQSWSAPILLHGDYSSIAFAAGDSNKFYVGNDGGIWFSSDGGKKFTSRNRGLSITQFYSIAVHPTDANIALGGTQDNGTELYTGIQSWPIVFGGDGGFTAIDQTKPNIMYTNILTATISSGQYQLVHSPVRSRLGGTPDSWVLINNGIDVKDSTLLYPPFILDPNNQSTLYYGTYRLYRSTDQGDNWSSISAALTNTKFGSLSALAVAPGAPQIIYTGASDGGLFKSENGGDSFRNVKGNLPTRYISDIIVDNNRIAYLSLSGFKSGHVYKSVNGDDNWQDISGNLPDLPANALALNPLNPDNLFVGTDIGLFETNNGGKDWLLLPGLPSVPVLDLAVNANLGLVFVATHGRGIYQKRFSKDLTPPDVTITSPTGGETLIANNQFTISWQASDNVGVTRQDIGLSTDSGKTFPFTIASGLAGNDQSFQWTVPMLATQQARVRITSFDAANNAGSSVSNGDFQIAISDFALTVNPTTQVIKPGDSASFTIALQSLNQFTQSVDLTASITPANSSINTTLSTSNVIAGGNATLMISTAASTPAGNYSVTVTGRAAGIVHTVTATITLAMPDFALNFTPDTITTKRGKGGSLTVNIDRQAGFTGNITVIRPDTKALKIKLSPDKQTTNAASVSFNFKVMKKAATGSQQLLFTGQDESGRVRNATLTLIIQ